mmetsp:Transcript_46780/g.130235  ORF Transcript_46780/g.130235 Transcript_46780/m.130235 type:complete len:119 (-) Transcript_46780:36-392(-)|eukprot:CAMPEP_0179129910 /NCGR_PEP_ID=MMETSP0796-20121207/61655_1 /TAXON_ID=73915 /ORGANISM="Pyrodinium bahamense, Strain pbaha01" /LENGTH=118 /DNA_ID=CAMNT_0020828799 /DNA_START=451 /DNA_END=807 /DNA_ORIENTATION=+
MKYGAHTSPALAALKVIKASTLKARGLHVAAFLLTAASGSIAQQVPSITADGLGGLMESITAPPAPNASPKQAQRVAVALLVCATSHSKGTPGVRHRQQPITDREGIETCSGLHWVRS